MTFERGYFRRQYKQGAGDKVSFFLRYAYWRRWMARRKSSDAVIFELGSGLGHFIRQCPSAIASDISGFGCRELAAAGHSRVVRSTANEIPFAAGSVDFVFAFDVLEHLEEPGEALKEVQRVLKPDGWLVMTVPNPEGYGARSKPLSWAGLQDPTHINILRRHEWERLLNESSLDIERMGSDFLWDPPYLKLIPAMLQRIALLPGHLLTSYFFGSLPWMAGETLIFAARKRVSP